MREYEVRYYIDDAEMVRGESPIQRSTRAKL